MSRLLMVSILFLILATSGFKIEAQGGESGSLKLCMAKLENDVLVIGNNLISRRYRWNGGDLISLSIEDKQNQFIWELNNQTPDCDFPGLEVKASSGRLKVTEIAATASASAHLRAEVIYKLGELYVKRTFRIYPDCPAIACDYWLRGKADEELVNAVNDNKQPVVMEHLALPGRQWRMTPVELFDQSDVINTLVQTSPVNAYRKISHMRGNILFANNQLKDKGIFILKESPLAVAQLNYPGYDFSCIYGDIKVVGMGLQPGFLDENEWVRYYGFVTGVSGSGELAKLSALRSYQDNNRHRRTDGKGMIMMNTWGDRSRDTKVSEKFALEELNAGARLGVTHFALDDGWQIGRSGASVYGGSLQGIWRNSDYWKLKPDKFPNGLDPVVKRGKEVGIEVCLWFNPSADNSYARWESDADIMIDYYRKYGIRNYKIDGVEMPDKQAEKNLRKMFKKVIEEIGPDVAFELDITGITMRFGYFYFNEYGPVFVENRYTDFGNYYPHWTLRNLWMLSRYVPPQNLQMEFLNKWRNKDKYPGDDRFAPHNIPFGYVFAITMMAQPYAWFEATGLPEEAFDIAPLIKTYKEHWADIYAGMIFPIGDEPSGKSWTGFQSVNGNKGYFLVFREDNKRNQAAVDTWLPAGQSVKCQVIAGAGKDFEAVAGEKGTIHFSLPERNNFALYKYTFLEGE